MKFIFENVNIYIYIYKEAAVACTKQLNCTKTMVVVVVVVIITGKHLMFSLHSQLASDEYLIPGYGNEDPRMLA